MKSTILISRIMRIIETDGALGEGASLAEVYAQAVRSVNARLESVHAAVEAKQVSDAVRIMEDSPRLLDEINTLDFNRLPDWEMLCERCGWEKPVPFDRSLIERALMLNSNTSSAEPYLRMYRKAVRTNNNALAVKALRRLAEVDHSQNWLDNLGEAERDLQRSLLEEFSAARGRGDEDAMVGLAEQLLNDPWQKPPSSRGIEDVRAFVDEREARRRNAEGKEDIELLKKCHDGAWNRTLAFSMLQAIDVLAENGWTMPDDAKDMVAECRRRCAEEMEAEERERSWKECCETLHGAVQREDTAAIRDALAAPDFLDREPPEDLLRDAERVIEHEDAARRRKVMQIGFCALAALAAVLGVSGWWLRQKLFNDRCNAEAVKLAALEKGDHAIDRLGEALSRLKANDPEVYGDPRVNVYEGKHRTMCEKNLARTNEIAEIIASLAGFRDAMWSNVAESVTGQFAKAESMMTAEDVAFRSEWRKLKASWNEHLDEVAAIQRKDATASQEKIKAAVATVQDRLLKEIGGTELNEAADKCKEAISEWEKQFSILLPELDGELTEVEKNLAEAMQSQKNVKEAIDRLRNAASAPEIAMSRKMLIDNYSSYAPVAKLKPYPFEENEIRDVIEGVSPEQKAFADAVKYGIDAAPFKTFLEESVTSLAEIPAYYSLVGLLFNGDSSHKFFAVAKGRPDIKKPSYEKRWQIKGEILSFVQREMVDSISTEDRMGKPMRADVASIDEIKEIVDLGKQTGLTVGKFEDAILKRIAKHLEVAHAKGFAENEGKWENHVQLTYGRYPAWRRVQILDIYFRWLNEDLKLMPADDSLGRWIRKVEELAQAISITGIPDDLTWVCLWEPRVRRRNTECARLLANFPNDWVANYKAWRSARYEFRAMSDWKIELAGRVLFDPLNATLTKDPKAVIPVVMDGVAADHPLYVLRRTAGKIEFRKALVPSNGRWARTVEMGNGYMPGEPLFHVVCDGKPIDAEKELGQRLGKMPVNIVGQMVAKIPFFGWEVK